METEVNYGKLTRIQVFGEVDTKLIILINGYINGKLPGEFTIAIFYRETSNADNQFQRKTTGSQPLRNSKVGTWMSPRGVVDLESHQRSAVIHQWIPCGYKLFVAQVLWWFWSTRKQRNRKHMKKMSDMEHGYKTFLMNSWISNNDTILIMISLLYMCVIIHRDTRTSEPVLTTIKHT